MKHFTTEQWIDFVNQAVSADTKHAMEKHLERGCKPCSRTISLWQRIRRAAILERNYQPPIEAVQSAQSAFSRSSLVRKRKQAFTWANVLFDSFLQPAFEGARSAASSARQMLYRADPYQIDVQIEMGTDTNTLVITGQILDLRQPGLTANDVTVAISNLRGPVERTTTNQFGEFRQEIPDTGDLELVFPGLADKPVIISLRDPLGRLPAGKRSSPHRKIRKT